MDERDEVMRAHKGSAVNGHQRISFHDTHLPWLHATAGG